MTMPKRVKITSRRKAPKSLNASARTPGGVALGDLADVAVQIGVTSTADRAKWIEWAARSPEAATNAVFAAALARPTPRTPDPADAASPAPIALVTADANAYPAAWRDKTPGRARAGGKTPRRYLADAGLKILAAIHSPSGNPARLAAGRDAELRRMADVQARRMNRHNG